MIQCCSFALSLLFTYLAYALIKITMEKIGGNLIRVIPVVARLHRVVLHKQKVK
jgi:hypothetical protein